MGDWIQLFGGKGLDAWRGRTQWAAAPNHTWRIVGEVRLNTSSSQLLIGEPETGVMFNGDGRTADLHTTLEHGSCELHVEFCVAAKAKKVHCAFKATMARWHLGTSGCGCWEIRSVPASAGATVRSNYQCRKDRA